MRRKTEILHSAASRDKSTGALSIPIYPASTYHQADIDNEPQWEYGRSANPTRSEAEKLLASLEGCEYGFAFSSGMAAIAAAITAVVKAGDHIVATQDIYGGSYRYLTKYISGFGVTHTFVDMTNPSNVLNALQKNTRLILMETPSNPLLRVTDIRAVVEIAKQHSIVTALDNTFMTPYLQRVLDLGVDISIHSATKFLAGHSDLIAGAIMTADKHHANAVKFVQNACGSVLSPNDSWMLIRGIKTLSARMEIQCANAMKLAQWLTTRDWVREVYYPGLSSHPGHEIIKNQASGFGAVISVKIDSVERAIAIMKKVKYWNVAVSLGGVESILSYPRKMSHAAIPEQDRHTLGITDDIVRLSVGLEDVDDLIEDLENAAVE
jgi:cystathionine beta-lyase/cystathionine gamma-synthase